MIYISIVMGLLVGALVHYWLTLAEVKERWRLIASIVVAVLVMVFTYTGDLSHF